MSGHFTSSLSLSFTTHPINPQKKQSTKPPILPIPFVWQALLSSMIGLSVFLVGLYISYLSYKMEFGEMSPKLTKGTSSKSLSKNASKLSKTIHNVKMNFSQRVENDSVALQHNITKKLAEKNVQSHQNNDNTSKVNADELASLASAIGTLVTKFYTQQTTTNSPILTTTNPTFKTKITKKATITTKRATTKRAAETSTQSLDEKRLKMFVLDSTNPLLYIGASIMGLGVFTIIFSIVVVFDLRDNAPTVFVDDGKEADNVLNKNKRRRLKFVEGELNFFRYVVQARFVSSDDYKY